MIWESVFLMSVIDVLILAAVVAAVWVLFRNQRVITRAGAGKGGYAIVAGLVAIGAVYLVDLFIMHCLPLLTSEAAAQAAMQELHLHHSWWSMLIATGLIALGFTTATHKLLALTSRLQFTQFATDHASDHVFWMTADAQFVYVNDSACKALGYTRNELLSLSVYDIAPNYSPEAWRRFWEELRERRSFKFEAQHCTKRGKVLPVEIQVNYFQYEGRELNCSIVRDITERKLAETELREKQRQLMQTLEEREVISQNLHDGVLQSLYAIGLGLESCKIIMPKDPNGGVGQIDDAIGQLNALIAEIRGYVAGLHTDVRLSVDFVAGLNKLVSDLTRINPSRIHLDIDQPAAACLTGEQAAQLFYVAKECLSNSVRHAQAEFIRVKLRRENTQVRLEVQDDGIGFDPAQRDKKGYGLANLSSRASKIGASLKVNSIPGQGSHIQMVLPVPTQ